MGEHHLHHFTVFFEGIICGTPFLVFFAQGTVPIYFLILLEGHYGVMDTLFFTEAQVALVKIIHLEKVTFVRNFREVREGAGMKCREE